VRVSRRVRYFIHAYIWLIMILPWLFLYTVAPSFADMNSSDMRMYARNINAIYTWGNAAFNFVFAVEFARILNLNFSRISTEVLAALARGNANAHGTTLIRFKILAIKNLFHCATSTVACFLYTYYPVVGYPLYIIIVVGGLHLWFNFALEDCFLPSDPVRVNPLLGAARPAQSSRRGPARPSVERAGVAHAHASISDGGYGYDVPSRSIASWEQTVLGSRKSGTSREGYGPGFALVMPRGRGSSFEPESYSGGVSGNTRVGRGVGIGGLGGVGRGSQS
jgi:hypothetical protein